MAAAPHVPPAAGGDGAHESYAVSFAPTTTGYATAPGRPNVGVVGHILCPECGVSMPPNPSNLCVKCIRNRVDITEGIQKQLNVLWCKQCDRYHNPPKQWLHAELESKELLTFLVKRVKGLNKVKLVDANFIWTEPHSRRLKIKLTVQKEVLNGGTILQQSFLVEYIVEPHMCLECARITANPEQWVGCVQARQRAEHRRTFFFLEQLILKHGADENVIGVRKKADGLDFYFSHRSHSLKFVDFLGSVVPVRHRTDRQLVSHDDHNNTYRYKYTFFTEIVPVCKDDIVCLPRKLQNKAYGGIGPVLLCTRVGTNLTLTDPNTNRYISLDSNEYWRSTLRPLASQRTLTPYVVLDLELVGARGGGPDWDDAASMRSMRSAAGAGGGGTSVGSHVSRFQLADVTIARQSDLGANDQTVRCRTHLGAVLRVGDVVLGYDMLRLQISDEEYVAHAQRDKDRLPDVVLVRKSYEEKRKLRKERRAAMRAAVATAMATDGGAATAAPSAAGGGQFQDTGDRAWTLRTLDMQDDDDEMGGGGSGGKKKAKRLAKLARDAEDREATDRERFFEELEEDADLRSRVALYRKPAVGANFEVLRGEDDGDVSEDDVPEVPLDELMEALAIGDRKRPPSGDVDDDMSEDSGEEEAGDAGDLDDADARAAHTRRAILLSAGVKKAR